MGSGTTIVEAMVNDRIGTDVNEIVVLLAKVIIGSVKQNRP